MLIFQVILYLYTYTYTHIYAYNILLFNFIFLKKGTQMLKEILKIDASATPEGKTNEISPSTCKQDSFEPASQCRHPQKIGMSGLF